MTLTPYNPHPPQLLPTTIGDGQARGVRYSIQGELVPVLRAWLDGSVPLIFEHPHRPDSAPFLSIMPCSESGRKRSADAG